QCDYRQPDRDHRGTQRPGCSGDARDGETPRYRDSHVNGSKSQTDPTDFRAAGPGNWWCRLRNRARGWLHNDRSVRSLPMAAARRADIRVELRAVPKPLDGRALGLSIGHRYELDCHDSTVPERISHRARRSAALRMSLAHFDW